MKLPKMYSVVKVKFWTLRGSLGPCLGFVEIDAQVTRKARRVATEDGWKWQLVVKPWQWIDEPLLLDIDDESINECEFNDLLINQSH